MEVKGLQLPTTFVQLAEAIQQGGTHSFLPIGKIDPYGNLFDAPLVLLTTAQELHGWDDEALSEYGVTDVPPEELEEMNEGLEGDPGAIPYITDFSKIVCFGLGCTDYPFCFDFRDNLQEPSVIFFDFHNWIRVAPDFEAFMRLYRPSRQCNALAELWVGISPEDRDRIARTEEALAKTVFHGKPLRQFSVPVFSGRFGVLDRVEIETILTIESLKAYAGHLAQAGHEDVADAFQQLTKAVTQCEQLTAKQRHKMLRQLEWLSSQALRPPDKRVQPYVAEARWSGLARCIGEVGALAEVWHVGGARIRAFLGY